MNINNNSIQEMCAPLEDVYPHTYIVLQCEWCLKLNVMFSCEVDKDW
jgi:hypothetical protein